MPVAADTMPAMPVDDRPRCAWPGSEPLNLEHHDAEWGVPSRDRRHLFELLTLEGAQAGLSWLTILRKRAGYVAAFAAFEPERVADFTPADVERLLADPGIVRQRAKIEATIANARAILLLEAGGVTFPDFVWSFVGGRPKQNTWTDGSMPAETAESRAMSKELKRRGFAFVGPTTCYSFMQSAGLVNDHVPACFRHAECAALAW
jgi:DNA-3-methyladenine glycosylase I